MAEPVTNVLGIVGIKHCGEYDATRNYEKLNVVTYNGSSYCAKTSTTGNLPTNTDFWDLMAEKGSKGDTGNDGYTPVKGTDYYTAADKAELETTLSSDVTTEVTSQLGSLTSATPLVASSTAGMTDTTRIYVNTTDGHWYWYDGSDWQDGGTYQATGLGDNVVGTKNIKDFAVTYPKIGDANIKSIVDFFIENQVLDVDLTAFTYKTTTGDFNGMSNLAKVAYGYAYPITLSNNTKFKYFYAPKITVEHDAILHLSILDDDFAAYEDIEEHIVYDTTVNVTQGSHTNFSMPLYYDFSDFNIGDNYYLAIWCENTTQTGHVQINIASVNPSTNYDNSWLTSGKNVFIYNMQGNGAWIIDSSASNRPPLFGLSNTNPIIFNFDDYVSTITTSPFTNKKISILGDSITASTSVTDNLTNIVGNLLRCNNVNNYGINGSTLGGDGTTISPVTNKELGYEPMVNRYSEIDNDSDYVIIFGGTNDYGRDVGLPVGLESDNTVLTFYGSLNILIPDLITNYPTARIAFITPPHRKPASNNNYINYFGNTLDEYVDAINKICKKYSIPVLDLYNTGCIYPENTTWKNANMPDGLHPNQDFYYVLGNKIAEFIKGL